MPRLTRMEAAASQPASPPARRLLPAVVITGCLALFFAPALAGSRQFLYRDSGRLHHPVKRLVAEELARGHLPLWNPYNGMGAPLVGGAVDAVQHPFNLLLVALPFELGFKLWVLLSFVLAAGGCWAWTRALGCGRRAATMAALAFALSGYLVSSSDNLFYLTSYAAVPLFLAAAHAFLVRGGVRPLALIGLASALLAAGGDPVAWAMATGALPAYGALVVAERGGRWRTAGRGLVGVAAAVAGAAPFVFPVLAWLPSSSRGEALDAVELLRWNLAPARLAELAVPYAFRSDPGSFPSLVFMVYGGDGGNTLPWVISVYLGAGLLALAVAGALTDRRARLLALAAVGVTWMAMGHYGGFDRVVHGLPALSTIRYGEKLVAWIGLLVAAAAAFGLDALTRDRVARRLGIGALVAGGVLLAWHGAGLEPLLRRAPPGEVAALVGEEGAAQAARALAANLAAGMLHAGAVLVLLGLSVLAPFPATRRALGGSLVAAVVVLDPFVANRGAYVLLEPTPPGAGSAIVAHLAAEPGPHRIITPAAPLHLYPDLSLMDSMMRYCSLTLCPELNSAARVGNFDPYAGMIPARISRFLRRAGRIEGAARRVGLFAVEAAVLPLGAEQTARAGVVEHSGVLVTDPALRTSLVGLPHRPRAYLAGALRSVDRRAAMEFALAADAAAARSADSVLESAVPDGYVPPQGSARIVRYEWERVEVETRSDRRALLILNDIFTEGWTASVDGRPAEILPANYLARGVWVEAGEHRVTFAYRAAGLGLGWLVFGLGAAAAILALAIRAAAGRRPPGAPARSGLAPADGS